MTKSTDSEDAGTGRRAEKSEEESRFTSEELERLLDGSTPLPEGPVRVRFERRGGKGGSDDRREANRVGDEAGSEAPPVE